MSFSSDVKKEIGTISNLAKKEQIRHELIGYLISSNVEVVKNGKRCSIKFATENDYNINRFSKLLSNLDIQHDIGMSGKLFVIEIKLKANNQIISQVKEVNILEKNIEIVDETKLFSEKDENKKAIIRGMFLGSGSINNPQNKYHFEISFSSERNLKFGMNLASLFNINSKKLITKDRFSMYIKEGEEISKILALIGANKAVLNFEDIRIEREMRGKINRLVNCETANLTKTINAAVEQIEAIERLKREKRFKKLNDSLKEIAELRLKYPDMTLTELGKKANPPVGKSGVNYRLKKIMEIANG